MLAVLYVAPARKRVVDSEGKPESATAYKARDIYDRFYTDIRMPVTATYNSSIYSRGFRSEEEINTY